MVCPRSHSGTGSSGLPKGLFSFLKSVLLFAGFFVDLFCFVFYNEHN